MKKFFVILIVCVFCGAVFAGPPGPPRNGHRGGHHGQRRNDGLALAAGIVNLVGHGLNILTPRTQVIVSQPVQAVVPTTTVIQPTTVVQPQIVVPNVQSTTIIQPQTTSIPATTYVEVPCNVPGYRMIYLSNGTYCLIPIK